MEKFYIPTKKPEDWISLLADEKHWRPGYSAMALAHSWQGEKGFPARVKDVFQNSGETLFKNLEFLRGFPEYKVSLKGGSRASQNDIFVLAKNDDDLLVIMVEGKVRESFGGLISEWGAAKDTKTNKTKRLEFLLKELHLENKPLDGIRYQLLHRTASALIEAKKLNAKYALMLVHSFSQKYEHFSDYERFLTLFGLKGEKDSISGPVSIGKVTLYFGWVRGDKKYLFEKEASTPTSGR